MDGYSLATAAVSIGLIWLMVVYRHPWVGVAFGTSGSTLYYATLHAIGVGASGPLTGVVFGGTLLTATASLALRSRARLTVWHGLFAFFVLVWFVRWSLEPPHHDLTGFGERAPVFMLVFGIGTFVSATLLDCDGRGKLGLAMLVLGQVSLAIVLVYWSVGAPNLGPPWSNRWEPIPSLSGIVMSLDIGAGTLGLVLSYGRRRPLVVAALFVLALFLMLRIGQRGPVLCMMLALFAVRAREFRDHRAWLAGAGIAAVLVLVATNAEDASRVLSADSYSLEGNNDRLTVFRQGFTWIGQRPLTGWGGSRVGLPVGDQTWDYIHMTLLDPLLETGVVGAIPFWALLFGLLHRAATLSLRDHAFFAALLVYAVLEHQFSGHVSTARHLWLGLGVIAGWGATGPVAALAPLRAHGSAPRRNAAATPAPSAAP